jgi:hypothetical protein
VKADVLGELIVKLRSPVYVRYQDRSLWPASVKAETVRVVDRDDRSPGADVYWEMAKVLVMEGVLQAGEYTISHLETFQTFLNRRIDSDADAVREGACEARDLHVALQRTDGDRAADKRHNRCSLEEVVDYIEHAGLVRRRLDRHCRFDSHSGIVR